MCSLLGGEVSPLVFHVACRWRARLLLVHSRTSAAFASPRLSKCWWPRWISWELSIASQLSGRCDQFASALLLITHFSSAQTWCAFFLGGESGEGGWRLGRAKQGGGFVGGAGMTVRRGEKKRWRIFVGSQILLFQNSVTFLSPSAAPKLHTQIRRPKIVGKNRRQKSAPRKIVAKNRRQ